MIKKYYQEVIDINGDSIKVIDFEKLRAEGHSFNIIMSEREKVGKTTSALQMIKTRWDKYGEKAIYVLNSEDMLQKFKHKLIAANRLLYSKQWKNVIVKGNGLMENNKVFCYFASISAPHKFKIGGRDPMITSIIYDEFNEGLSHVRQKQVKSFETIVLSCNQANAKNTSKHFLQAFIFANNETMNVPMLLNYGITSINKELEIYRFENDFSVLVYVPRISNARRLKINQTKNWMVGMTKVSKSIEINIFNSANWDNTSGVIPKEEQKTLLDKATTQNEYVFFYRNYYAKIWYFNKGHFFMEYKTSAYKPKIVYVLGGKKNIDLDNTFNGGVRDIIYDAFLNKTIWFSNYPLKEEFHDDLFGKRKR